MTNIGVMSVWLTVGALSGPAVLAAEPSGDMIGRTCFGCHGSDGISKGAVPGLAGYPAKSLARTMRDFRADRRPGSIMNRIAKGYSDSEIDAMAGYFGSLKKKR